MWDVVTYTCPLVSGTKALMWVSIDAGDERVFPRKHHTYPEAMAKAGRSSQIFVTRDSEVIMFSPCVFVCVCVCLSMFVTMFVRTISLWRTGAKQTIFCRYLVGEV